MTSSRYSRELLTTLAVYALLLLGSVELLTHVPIGAPWRDAIALTPMIGCSGAIWAILRELRRMDELQRRIQLEAFGFAFAGTAFVTLSYGFLEGLGYARLTMFLIWPLMASLWIVGLVLARRRYR